MKGHAWSLDFLKRSKIYGSYLITGSKMRSLLSWRLIGDTTKLKIENSEEQVSSSRKVRPKVQALKCFNKEIHTWRLLSWANENSPPFLATEAKTNSPIRCSNLSLPKSMVKNSLASMKFTSKPFWPFASYLWRNSASPNTWSNWKHLRKSFFLWKYSQAPFQYIYRHIKRCSIVNLTRDKMVTIWREGQRLFCQKLYDSNQRYELWFWSLHRLPHSPSGGWHVETETLYLEKGLCLDRNRSDKFSANLRDIWKLVSILCNDSIFQA